MHFCHANAASAKKYKDEIFNRFGKMDIISINETNLHEKTQFQLPGFNVFRFDRSQKKGGGVLLAIRKEISCYEV
ncbi:unnamed protein product, partial [Adineta steineri]